MLKQQFTDHIRKSNITGSNKASSYIKAIDWLCKMIATAPQGFDDCLNIWSVSSVERLEELYQFLRLERKIKEKSKWVIKGIPVSYLEKGYCSAAIRSFQSFLSEYSYEENIFDRFTAHNDSEESLIQTLNIDFNYPECLIEEKIKEEGIDVVRTVKTRLNQSAFRRMVLTIYNDTCCISGLDIPQVNRASHIIPWSENKETRLDPRNGLCLSATYDAAFDRNLISLDDDYRMIVSKSIKEHYTSESVKKYFTDREGTKISIPKSYQPKITYLTEHRKKGDF